jgi:hypothetical protein
MQFRAIAYLRDISRVGFMLVLIWARLQIRAIGFSNTYALPSARYHYPGYSSAKTGHLLVGSWARECDSARLSKNARHIRKPSGVVSNDLKRCQLKLQNKKSNNFYFTLFFI